MVGETYPIPDGHEDWADYHLSEQAKRVAPYPEQLASTLERAAADRVLTKDELPTPAPAKADPRSNGSGHHTPGSAIPRPTKPTTEHRPTTGTPAPNSRRGPGHPQTPAGAETTTRDARPNYEAPPPRPRLNTSPVRRLVGQKATDKRPRTPSTVTPEALRELAFLGRINEIGPADQCEGATALPRLYDQDYAILALLDRAGLATRALIGRATLPGRAPSAVISRMTKLHRHGLIAQHRIGVRKHTRSDGKLPLLYSLTRRGLETAQHRSPAPAISTKREWRAIEQHNAGRLSHDLHALSWGIELHRLIGDVATDHWRTPSSPVDHHRAAPSSALGSPMISRYRSLSEALASRCDR